MFPLFWGKDLIAAAEQHEHMTSGVGEIWDHDVISTNKEITELCLQLSRIITQL